MSEMQITEDIRHKRVGARQYGRRIADRTIHTERRTTSNGKAVAAHGNRTVFIL